MITDEMIGAACIAAFGTMTPILRERAKRALEAADRAAWQPIETAPKDGTYVLLHLPMGLIECAGKNIIAGAWRWIGPVGLKWHTEGGRYCPNPLRWRPLPEPPETAP